MLCGSSGLWQIRVDFSSLAYGDIWGVGNNFGVALGTLIFITLRKLIVYYKYSFAFLPFDVVWLEYLLLGSIILLILIFRPSGILKETPSQTIPQARLEKIVGEVSRKESERQMESV